MTTEPPLTLTLRKLVKASPERVFSAWTEPRRIIKWWGPKHVDCIDASLELSVGGRYRIANKLPDGSILWIDGAYEEITPPERLVFSWIVEGLSPHPEKVIVEFQARNAGRATEVVVTHERMPDAETRESHEIGWIGSLEGLADYLA